jgi:hypothetical protein
MTTVVCGVGSDQTIQLPYKPHTHVIDIVCDPLLNVSVTDDNAHTPSPLELTPVVQTPGQTVMVPITNVTIAASFATMRLYNNSGIVRTAYFQVRPRNV